MKIEVPFIIEVEGADLDEALTLLSTEQIQAVGAPDVRVRINGVKEQGLVLKHLTINNNNVDGRVRNIVAEA